MAQIVVQATLMLVIFPRQRFVGLRGWGTAIAAIAALSGTFATGQTAITVTRTVSSGASVAVNTFVVVDSAGYVKTLSTAGSPCGDGVGLSSAAAGTTVQVASYGTVSVYVDASGAAAGNLAECSASVSYPGNAHDSGTTTSANVPLGTQIVGRFMTPVTGSGSRASSYSGQAFSDRNSRRSPRTLARPPVRPR